MRSRYYARKGAFHLFLFYDSFAMLMGGIEPPSPSKCRKPWWPAIGPISVNLPNEGSHLSRYNMQLLSRWSKLRASLHRSAGHPGKLIRLDWFSLLSRGIQDYKTAVNVNWMSLGECRIIGLAPICWLRPIRQLNVFARFRVDFIVFKYAADPYKK